MKILILLHSTTGNTLLLTSFVTGLAIMAAEVAAGRLVAPYYGTSNLVWALIIGAVLASLAVGQVVGGRLSRRLSPTRTMGWLLLLAGLLLIILPLLGRPLMRGSLDLFVGGNTGTLMASAAVITALMSLPMMALGAISPLLIHVAVEDTRHTGAVAGRLYALGTAGGLLGTYLSGLLLVPWLGTRATFWVCGSPLILLGLWYMSSIRRGGTVAGLVISGLFLSNWMGLGEISKHPHTIYEGETSYNYVRVQEEGGVRKLLLNEGFAPQSLYSVKGALPLADVWGFYAAAPSYTRSGRCKRALILGVGGGTAALTLRRLYPAMEVVGVELDPGVVAVGRRLMGLPQDVKVVADDARAFLRRDRSRYDVIILDAFQFPYIPFQLSTLEFFQSLAAHLRPGGAVVINVGRDGEAYHTVNAMARTAGEVFAHVRGADANQRWNTVLVVTRHPPEQDAGLSPLGLPHVAAQRLRRLPPLRPWPEQPGAPVLTDDRAPVEALTDWIVLRRLLSPS